MEITDAEFWQIVNYVQEKYGINLSKKRVLVSGRLQNYLIRNGYENYRQYMDYIKRHPEGKEATNLINVLTTNHTFFMREFEHMEFLKEEILPWIMKTHGDKRDVRIWSAAASTGEEPYTISMILNDYFCLEHSWNTQMLATDISTKVLEMAKRGVYLQEQIAPLPDTWKRRYFHKMSQEKYQVVDEIRKNIIFKKFNLMDEIPFKGLFQVVFLRNVMIYFNEDIKRKLVQRICNHMERGGYLIIGTTESIDKTKFPLRYVKPSIYRKI